MMDDTTLAIASASNERYAIGLGVMMCSVLSCAGKKSVRFHILDDGITPETKSHLIDRVMKIARLRQVDVEFNFIDFSRLDLPSLTPLNGSMTAYGRIFLPHILDESSVFHVDADIICEHRFPNVDELLLRHPDALIAGCLDPIEILAKDCPWQDEILDEERQLAYINTGFIWMNLEGLRAFGLLDKFRDLAAKGRPMAYADQTALNFLCRGRIGLISPHYNHLWNKSKGLGPDDICNIHFVGPVKPWHARPSEGNLQQIRLFGAAAKCFGIAYPKLSGIQIVMISALFQIRNQAKLLFYKLTLNKRLETTRARLKKWRLMKAYMRSYQARLRETMPPVGGI